MAPKTRGRPATLTGYKRVGTSVKPEHKEALESMTEATGVPETELLRRAIENYLERNGYLQ